MKRILVALIGVALLAGLWPDDALTLTPTSRWGLKYSAGDSLIVEGKFFAPKDSLFMGGRKIGNLAHQDSQSVHIDSLTMNRPLLMSISDPLFANAPMASFTVLDTTYNKYVDIKANRYGGLRVYTARAGAASGSSVFFLNSRGTVQTPLIAAAADQVGSFFAQAYDGHSYRNIGGIFFNIDTTIDSAATSGNMMFYTNPGTEGVTHQRRMTITKDGQVGIGTNAPPWADSTLTVIGSGSFSTNLLIGGHLVPAANKTKNVGSATASWDTTFSKVYTTTADIPLDTYDYLAGIKAIKGSGTYDPVSGLEIVDDWTLPLSIMLRHNRDWTEEKLVNVVSVLDSTMVGGELYVTERIVSADTLYVDHKADDLVVGPDGKPFFIINAAIGELLGAVRQLIAAVEDEELGGVPLVRYVIGLAAIVAALSGYVATLKIQATSFKEQINTLEARVAKLEGVAPNPPNPEP